MINTEFRESETPLLRADQIQNLREDQKSLEATLKAPPHIANQIQDRGAMQTQLRGVVKMLHDQAPKAYDEGQIDSAKARLDTLQESFLNGMPTQEEMRKNPPGATGKNINWEKEHKCHVLEWKNIIRRLAESGHIPEGVKAGEDLANVERLRPVGGAHQLSMDNAQIEGTQYHMVESPRSVVFNDSELDQLAEIDPEIRDGLITASPEVRAGIKQFLIDAKAGNLEPVSMDDTKHRCGAPTRNNSECQTYVDSAGDKCHHHKE